MCEQCIVQIWFQIFEQQRVNTNHSLWPQKITVFAEILAMTTQYIHDSKCFERITTNNSSDYP